MSRVTVPEEDMIRIYNTLSEAPATIRKLIEEIHADMADLKVERDEAVHTLNIVLDGNKLFEQNRRMRKLMQGMLGWIQPHKNDYRTGQQAPVNCTCDACTMVRDAKQLIALQS